MFVVMCWSALTNLAGFGYVGRCAGVLTSNLDSYCDAGGAMCG